VIIALAMIRVSRQDLAGAGPEPAAGTSSPDPAPAPETHAPVMAIQPAGTRRPGPGEA
jgi:hypothetical protein